MHFARVEVTRILSLVLLPCSPSPPTFARSVIPGNWCMLSVESRRTGIARRRLSSTGFPQPLRSARGRSAARRRRVPARLSQRWVAQPPLDLLVGLGGAKVAVQKHVQAQRVVPTFMILGPRPSAGGDDGAAPSEPAAAAWAWPCTFGRDDSMTSTLGAAGCTVQSCTSPLWQDSQSRCPRLVCLAGHAADGVQARNAAVPCRAGGTDRARRAGDADNGATLSSSTREAQQPWCTSTSTAGTELPAPRAAVHRACHLPTHDCTSRPAVCYGLHYTTLLPPAGRHCPCSLMSTVDFTVHGPVVEKKLSSWCRSMYFVTCGD